MKKYFITGLVILLPLALTVFIIVFLMRLLTEPFVGVVSEIFRYYGIFQKDFLILSATQMQRFFGQILIVGGLFLFTILLGILTRWVFIHYIIRLGEAIFHRIPFVRSIYKTTQDVIKTIFTTDTKAFKQVVLAPFPNPETYSLGLVTRENFPGMDWEKSNHSICVFVPTTPNPTSGFLMLYKPDDLVYLDMTVEDAFKYIISCGVIATPFKTIPYHSKTIKKEA